MRIATWNIQAGRGARGSIYAGGDVTRDSLVRLAETIAEHEIDVIALQEVDRFQERTSRLDQTAIIAEALGAADARFVPHYVGQAGSLRLPPPRLFSDTPGFGVAIISRLPVVSWHARRFPLRLPKIQLSSVGEHLWNRLRIYDTTRSLLAATIREGDALVSLANLHAPAAADVARAQQIQAAHSLRSLPGTRILAGDFNVGPSDVAATLPGTNLVTAPTFPNPNAASQIDHLIADTPVTCGGAHVCQMPFSDHCLAWADIAPSQAAEQ